MREAIACTQCGGYREYQAIAANLAVKVREATPEVLTLMPTGVSALVALEQVGEMKSQEVVLVTAAAGGTGHIAVQLAKLAGNHVIGTCSSEAKAQLLRELGCDRDINYRTEDLDRVLKQEYPKGINLVFDCVGKEVFDTCVDNLAVRGRLVAIGFISEYAKNPERVNKLLLANIDYFDERDRIELSNTWYKAFKIKEDGSHLRERWNFLSSYIDSIELRHRCFLDELKCHGYPPYGLLAVLDYTEKSVKRFSLSGCSTLILSGTEDIKQIAQLRFIKAENREVITKVIPHAKAVNIEGGAFFMMNQMPEKISKVVVNFLDSDK